MKITQNLSKRPQKIFLWWNDDIWKLWHHILLIDVLGTLLKSLEFFGGLSGSLRWDQEKFIQLPLLSSLLMSNLVKWWTWIPLILFYMERYNLIGTMCFDDQSIEKNICNFHFIDIDKMNAWNFFLDCRFSCLFWFDQGVLCKREQPRQLWFVLNKDF